MAISSYQELSWGDKHTRYLCQLYTLYSREISWPDQLCDFGYYGYPDPRFEGKEGVYKPDLLAYGVEGDVQHFSVLSFPNGDESEDQIIDEIESATRYREIDNEMIQDYLDPFGVSPDLKSHHEIVVLISKDTYSEHQSEIEAAVNNNDLILWLISSNGSDKIWKETGDHTNLDLNSQMRSEVETYPGGDDLLQFSRNTDRARLQYEFIQRLVKYCSRERQRTFKFNEIDEVMTEIRPRMLWHLPRDEREEYWKDFLYSLLNSLELIVQTENQNEYRWKKQKFQSEPRYRRKILSKTKEELGLNS